MNIHNISNKLNYILILFFLGLMHYSSAQQLSSELHVKLSSSDQEKIKKAEELTSKGKKIEDEITPENKDERKFQLKRLEAADYYQNANSKKEKVYTDNINAFWKKYTGEKKLLDFARKIELASVDSFKQAGQLRNAADKERKMADRIALLTKAERLESKSLVMKQKVLFTYLNWPIEYDHAWVSTDDEGLPGKIKTTAAESPDNKGILAKKPETMVAPKDTSSSGKPKTSAVGMRKPTVIIVKPKQTPAISATPGEKPIQKDTAGLMPAKSAPAAVMPPAGPEAQVTKSVKNITKDSIPSFTSETGARKPAVKETIVGNDSSLYGKIQVKEDQIDKFNEFLKKKYPSKMEDYVINFQELDYSDVNALREAWYKYQYGYLTEDSAAMLAEKKDTTAKEIAANVNVPGDEQKLDGKTGQKQTGLKDKRATKKAEPITADHTGKKGGKKVDQSANVMISKDTVFTPAEGFIFRVQIVACRVPLDNKTLHSIYNGPLQIIELKEDNWYKYAIGQFTTYKEARKLRDQSNIPGVFVIAYLNGKRIKITPAIAYKKFTTKNTPDLSKIGQIAYYIQIAASKSTLSDTYLKNIYSGPITIEVKKDNEWNKYMLPAGKTFREASETLKKISIPGAFIIVYQNDTRIELQNAIKITQ